MTNVYHLMDLDQMRIDCVAGERGLAKLKPEIYIYNVKKSEVVYLTFQV